jgi:thiamine biosynthesis lipoprotein
MYKFFLILLTVLLIQSCKHKTPEYINNKGGIFGTYYYTVYESPKGEDLGLELKTLLDSLNNSLSTYQKESVLSKVNSNREVELDSFFTAVFKRSLEIAEQTNGAFDPTVAPLVNAWGFGFTKKETVTNELIDSIKNFVGYKKIRLGKGRVEKNDLRIMLDFSAIAKGYGVDIVADYLAKKGCKNYMVEIGGEVVARGVNQEGRIWRIGINEPNENEALTPTSLQAIISLENKAVATSGNYRNFYVEDGKKFAHTINPRTGYPVNHSLLSATVIANDCMTADAYATAFMVAGIDKAIEMSKKINDIDIFLIYADSDNENKMYISEGFEKYILE